MSEKKDDAVLAVVEEVVPRGWLSPEAVVAQAVAEADVLARVIEEKKLYAVTGRNRDTGQPRKHVTVEGWQTLGVMRGVYPLTEWTRRTPDFVPLIVESTWITEGGRKRKQVVTVQTGQGGWEARVILRTRDGMEVGAAEAECTWEEEAWRQRDSYALRSMAQTRATGKALRGAFAFVLALAGYEVTPADEIPEARPVPADMHNLPEGMDPTAWSKQVALVLADYAVDVAREAWADAVRITLDLEEDVAAPVLDQDQAEGVVAELHIHLAKEEVDASFGY